MTAGADAFRMTDGENYRFDISGFIVVRGVLSVAELDTYNKTIDQMLDGEGTLPPSAGFRYPFLQLRDHPVLAGYAEALCGAGYRPDTGPELLGADGTGNARLRGGSEWMDWSRAYFHRNGVRHCQGLAAVWALTDVRSGEGLVLIPASHISNVEAPEEVLTGADDMGLTVETQLQAGDLLLCADALVRRTSGNEVGPTRAVVYGYTSKYMRPHDWRNLDPVQPHEWAEELTPVERAVLHDPYRTGDPVVVRRDGDSGQLTVKDEGIYHPSIYIRNPDADIDEKEFYHWDLCGHLLVKGLMDADWIAAANAAIEANADRAVTVAGGMQNSNRLRGTHTTRMPAAWNLPQPYCEPFRRMIAHPAIIERLNWMMGSGYDATNCQVICNGRGAAGLRMHAGGTTERVENHYMFRNGRCYTEYINVAWQLRDVTAAHGGFCYIPGSHKVTYPMPDGVQFADDDMGMIRHLAMEAGDMLIFLAGAQTHGALPWMSDEERRCALFQYRSRNLNSEYAAARRRR